MTAIVWVLMIFAEGSVVTVSHIASEQACVDLGRRASA
jgi:hypothetical protein